MHECAWVVRPQKVSSQRGDLIEDLAIAYGHLPANSLWISRYLAEAAEPSLGYNNLETSVPQTVAVRWPQLV